MSPTSTSAPPWRAGGWTDLAAAPVDLCDRVQRIGWVERLWNQACSWLGKQEGKVLHRLPWANYAAVFGEKTFADMVKSRDTAQALVDWFPNDYSISVAEAIDTFDKHVTLWEREVHAAKAAGRFRGKTVRVLRW